MSVSGPTSKRLDKRVPAHIRRLSPGGVLMCDIQSDHDAVAVDGQDDAPAAGLDLDDEALEAGRVVVDPAPEARLVRLHGVGGRREAGHLCCFARRESVA